MDAHYLINSGKNMESKIERAKQLLDEWLAEEKIIDQARMDVMKDLQKKINEIQGDRVATRTKIAESIRLFERFKQEGNATENDNHKKRTEA
jgi:hypothetical protein